MELRAFGVCRACSAIYPSNRGCPNCDGDEASAREVIAARELAVAAVAADTPASRIAARPASSLRASAAAQWKPVLAVVSIFLLVSTLLAVLSHA